MGYGSAVFKQANYQQDNVSVQEIIMLERRSNRCSAHCRRYSQVSQGKHDVQLSSLLVLHKTIASVSH